MNTNTDLVRLSTASRALAACHDLGEIKRIRDQAEAIRQYVKAHQLGQTAQNEAADIKLRAERRAGELLKQTDRNKGAAVKRGDIVSPRLSEIGVTKKQSERWQVEAEVPEPEFERYVAETKAAGEELTSRGLLQLNAAGRGE